MEATARVEVRNDLSPSLGVLAEIARKWSWAGAGKKRRRSGHGVSAEANPQMVASLPQREYLRRRRGQCCWGWAGSEGG